MAENENFESVVVLQAEPVETVTVVAAAEDATRHAHIEDGVVVNIVLAHPDLADERGWVEIEGLDPLPQIGWTTTDGKAWEPPEPEMDDEPAEG